MQVKFVCPKNPKGRNYKTFLALFFSQHWSSALFFCTIFSQTRSKFTRGGYCDWKNTSARLIEHETSKHHLDAAIGFAGRSKEIGRIDQETDKTSRRHIKILERSS